jgi:hypothetical protein
VANNIAIKDGSGASVTVKSTDNGGTHTPHHNVDTIANALPAGEAHLGAVGGTTVTLTASYTRPADTTAYAAGDAVADSTSAPTALSFANAARVAAGSGVITGCTLTDSANQATKGQFELWIFDASVTPTNDNAAMAMSDGDAAKAVAIFQFTTWFVGNAGSGASGNAVSVGTLAGGNGRAFKLASGTTLYGLMVARNAYTPVSGEVFTFKLNVCQD